MPPRRDHAHVFDGPRIGLILCVLGSWLSAGTALSQPTATHPRSRLSYEVRTQIFAPSIRRSRIEATTGSRNDGGPALYFSPGLGLRLIADQGHALLLEGEYRFQVSPLISTDGTTQTPLRFGVAYAGYAFRFVARGPRNFRRTRRWAISPHVAIAAGAAEVRDDYPPNGIPPRSPTVGARAGLDLDIHIGRAFVGWQFSYEFLHHTRGTLTRSSFFVWNILPLFRVGVNLGRSVGPKPQSGRASADPR